MKTIKRLLKELKEKLNVIPYKTIELKTGVICGHYRNGNIKVLRNGKAK